MDVIVRTSIFVIFAKGFYFCLVLYKDYAAFTNHQWDPDEKGQGEASKYSSIEDVHNNIHALMGGNEGHMSELDYASYDPSFWLHHA